MVSQSQDSVKTDQSFCFICLLIASWWLYLLHFIQQGQIFAFAFKAEVVPDHPPVYHFTVHDQLKAVFEQIFFCAIRLKAIIQYGIT